jgi:hypothetical protein
VNKRDTDDTELATWCKEKAKGNTKKQEKKRRSWPMLSTQGVEIKMGTKGGCFLGLAMAGDTIGGTANPCT